MKPSYFLGILMLISIYWMGILYRPFLLNITIAILLVLATSEIYKLTLTYFNRPFWASLASTVILAALFFLPIVYFITTIVIQITHIDLNLLTGMVEQFNTWVKTDLPSSLQFLKPYLTDIADPQNISSIASGALDIVAKLGAKSAGFLKDIVMIVIFYFFILFYGTKLGNFFREIIPLNAGHTLSLYNGASGVMSVVFYSILVTAIFEGALFAIIAYAYGYDAILFGILYGFASLIPIVGGALMWLPISLYELSLGNIGSAVVIALYTIIVISIVADTFIKPVIIKFINVSFIKSKAPFNELIIFFAILAGLSSFGFWGMIIGPAITTFFISLLNLYRDIRHKEHAEPPVTVA